MREDKLDHCRIGSLEKCIKEVVTMPPRSLPHRQLRNGPWRLAAGRLGSLPHRQLRKADLSTRVAKERSLPHRQLRNF